MAFLLLLPILVSGFLVFTHHPYYYYRLHRYDGQLLYIATAWYGLVCSFVGAILVLLLNKYVTGKINILGVPISLDIASLIEDLLKGNISSKGSAIAPTESEEAGIEYKSLSLLLLTNVSSCVIALLWGKLARAWLAIKMIDFGKKIGIFTRIIKISVRGKWKLFNPAPSLSFDEKYRILLMSSILKDSPIDALFLISYISYEPLMLTLSNRKVYVGLVTSLGEPNETEGMDQEIVMTPILSGFRDSDTLQVSFTTRYSTTDEEVSIVIKQDQVISATKFNMQSYITSQRKEHSIVSGLIDLEDSVQK